LAGKANLDSDFRMSYLVFSFIIQYRLGNLTSAKALIEKLLADPYVQENEFVLGEIYIIYVFFCMLAGDHKKLAEICHELLHLGQKYNVPHQLGFAHRSLAHLYLREGHYNEARKEFGLSQDDFIRANNISYAHLTDLDLLLLRVKAGENAGDLLADTQCILDRLSSCPGGVGLDDYALSVGGIIAMDAGQIELARQRFEEVSLKCTRNGARQVLANAQLFLARLHLIQGNEGEADNYLREALSAAETEKWEYFWNWHDETMYAMCRRALLKNIHPTWAARILSRWFPQRTCQEAGYLLLYPDQKVRISITSIIENIVQETGVPVIHVIFLGGFHVFVNGVEIKPSQWKTKKAGNLYKYLLIKNGKHPKEKIIEELWTGTDPHRGDASLRMALTHVRKALGINNRESIILRRGMIYINPEIEIYTDYELFSSIVDNSFQDTAFENPVLVDSLKQAVQLYRGEFLPDNIYDDWTAGLREQMRQLYLQVLLRLIQCYRQQDKLSPAIQACHHYLTLEPGNELVCKAAMEMLWLTGQKQHALSLYQELAGFMSNEYNAAPSKEISSLFKRIHSS
ncbi:MAG: BTAD domain-containing putative transcriptional regulator, partial [Syntrophomonas sp.]